MLPYHFVGSLRFIHPRDLISSITAGSRPQATAMVQLRNEVRPVDLYCYLGARFGVPNGVHNFLRSDDSDNLIHWDWTLEHDRGLVSFLGFNFRTEVHFYGEGTSGYGDREELVTQLKSEFPKHGTAMADVRKSLELWTEFVNPYQRIRQSIDLLMQELAALDLRPDEEKLDTFLDGGDLNEWRRDWESRAARYTKGLGLCFGIRSMLPIMAEAFVNLFLYTLMRPEIKKDPRLRDNIIRQPIDVRIKSLSINCLGFKQQKTATGLRQPGVQELPRSR